MNEEKLKETGSMNDEEEQMSYDWPEDRFKELSQGQIIEAKVILVRDDAAFVDIGGKSDLTIPVEELTMDRDLTSAKNIVKVGDVIKVMVTRTGDEEKIQLSKRLVDQESIWLQLEDAFKSGATVSGTVTEIQKGGLKVDMSGGITAFMPASQATLGFSKNLENLVGQSFPVKILEFDRSKRKVLVSRRSLLEEEKKKNEEEFFSNIQEGDRRTGKITRIADFGAFVDLGAGIEGLIHVSELSWNRVKTPREVLNEGDQVEVLVIKVDQASKKISLSLKQIQVHPWYEAAAKFEVGKIYTGKVVRLEQFGAFIRLAPGVDGLVHISQIADHRISKPNEVLSIDDEVQAKVLSIDTANRKISLSLKEVGQDKDKQEVAQFMDAQKENTISQNLGDLLKK